ncbi:MAG: hypothetical protein Kow0097_01740 [Candidatus Bipolaricaulota bacterium]
MNTPVERERVQVRNTRPLRPGRYVLYWMQASQRAGWNPALEHARSLADELDLPLLAAFALAPQYPEATLRLDIPGLDLDPSVPPVDLPAGPTAARARLASFLEESLSRYADRRSDPSANATSGLSPYLHFGQISPVEVAWRVRAAGGAGAEAFVEELVVRRELALNFTLYNAHYDRFDGLPAWARETLAAHAADPRPATYDPAALDGAQTDDPVWNAAQQELRCTGTIHGYLRMYWGKQILLWTPDPERAFRLALHLNNRYGLDGRDPSSYAGVGWCFGLHDRPFPERPVWGKVRPMTRRGLAAKFDLRPYLARIASLARHKE